MSVTGEFVRDKAVNVKNETPKPWTMSRVIRLIGNVTMLIMAIVYLVSIVFGLSYLNNNVNINPLIIMLLLILLLHICAGLLTVHYCLLVLIPQFCYERNFSDSQKNIYFYDLAEHILLLLLSFGVWDCIWVFRNTNRLNTVDNMKNRSAIIQLLLYMFVPFYSVFWIFKSAQRIDILANKYGRQSKISVLCLIFAFVMPFVSFVVMQSRLNSFE